MCNILLAALFVTFAAMTFPSLLTTLGAILWIALGVVALTYVVGPDALPAVLVAAFLVALAAPYCSAWLKSRRVARLEAAAKADAAKKAMGQAAYRAETVEKLRRAGLTRPIDA